MSVLSTKGQCTKDKVTNRVMDVEKMAECVKNAKNAPLDIKKVCKNLRIFLFFCIFAVPNGNT